MEVDNVELHDKQLENYINASKEILELKDIEEVEHFFKHGEYEMAFEGLLIELIKAGIYPSEYNYKDWKVLGEHYILDRKTVFDETIWRKFVRWGMSYGGMIKEFDVVRAKRKLSNYVEAGTEGTVVIVHNSVDFEVEFVNQEGITLDILTVSLDDLDFT